MIVVHHLNNSRSQRVLWMLEELGLDYEIKPYQRQPSMQAPASLLTPFTYLQILWATAFGYAIFSQHPDAVSAAGMAIIVASGLSLALWERRRMRLL